MGLDIKDDQEIVVFGAEGRVLEMDWGWKRTE